MVLYRRASTWISDEVSVSWERKLAWDAARKDALAGALVGVYVGALGPFLGLVAAKTLHASVLLMSAMMMAPFIGNLLTPLWVHHLHGRPKLPFVIIPGVIARSLYLLLGLVGSAPQYVLVSGTAQLFEASTGPAYSALMERLYPRSMRGRIMSYVRLIRTIIAIVTTLIVGRMLDSWGYHRVFVVAALFGLASSAVFATVRVPRRLDRLELDQPRATPGAAWGIFQTDRAYRQFGLSVFLYGLGNLILSPVYPLFLANELKVSYSQQSILAFTAMVAAGIGFAGWGSFIDRHGSIKCVYVSIALVACKPLIFFLAHDYRWLIPAMLMDGISNAGIEIGYLNSILSFSPPEKIPSYQSLHATLLGIRGVMAPLIAGFLATLFQRHHLGLRPVFLVSAVLIFIGLYFVKSVRVPEDRKLGWR